MITLEECMESQLESEIKDNIRAVFGNKKSFDEKEFYNGIYKIIRTICARWGLFFEGDNAGFSRWGTVDKHRNLLALWVRRGDGIHLYPLREGQKIDLLVDNEFRTVEVVRNDDPAAGRTEPRLKLDVDDDVAVFGATAKMCVALPGSEHKQLNRATGEIEEIKKLE